MFVSVKDRTIVIEHYISYVKDAMSHHECSEEEYQAYLVHMQDLLTRCIEGLKKNSTNQKLITKYENMINNLFEK